MSTHVLAAVRELHEEELFADLLFFVSLRLEEHRVDDELSEEEQVLLWKLIGDAYRETDCFCHSIKVYQQALELSQRLAPGSHPKECTPTEIRFLIHKSCLREKQFDEAIVVLSAIPKHEHSLKTRSALAKLLSARLRVRSGKPSRELTEVLNCHQFIVSQLPHAYCSQNEILALRSTTPDFLDNNNEDHTSISSTYFRASRLVAELKALQAIEVLKSQKQPNARIIFELGHLYGAVGHREAAIRELERLKCLNPNSSKGMDTLAALYSKRDKKASHDLEVLVNYLNQNTPNAPETFIALGYLSRHLNRSKEATLFAQRALSLCGQGKAKAPAALLRVLLLMDQKRFDEADCNLKAMLAFDCRNIDALELSLHSLLSQKSLENVKQLGEMCIKNLGRENPRANFLYAQSIFHLPAMKKECELILRKCVEEHAYIEDAPRLLLRLNNQDKKYEEDPDGSLGSSFSDLTAKLEKTHEFSIDSRLALSLSTESIRSDRFVSHSLTPVPALSTPEFSSHPAYQMAPVAPRRQRNVAARQAALDLIQSLNFTDPALDHEVMPFGRRRPIPTANGATEGDEELETEIDVG